MYSDLDILPPARADHRALLRADARAFAAIGIFFEQAKAEPRLIQKFAEHGDNEIGSMPVNIVRWIEARNIGHNLLRVKFVPASPASGYRIICGYDALAQQRCINILAVAQRSDLKNYELTSPIAKRIIADWNAATGGRRTS